MSRYTLSEAANEDLTTIFEYVAGESHAAALKLSDRFLEQFDLLAANPLIGEARSDLADVAPAIRSFTLFSFVIYYRPVRGGVEIGRIARGARDARSLFNPID